MTHRNRRRFRSHLVNSELRLRLVIDDMVFAFIAALTAIGILYYLSNREIGDSLWSAHLSIKETKELLDKGVKVAGLVTFLAVLVFGFWSMLDAHRIAGPMHRLKRLLEEIATGNLTHEIEFRKRDEFQEIALSADAVVEGYSQRIRDLRATTDSLDSAAAKLSDAHSQEIKEKLKELRSQLDFFTVQEESN